MKKTKLIKITVFSDLGHAWGRVRRSLLVDLGIDGQVSLFSYKKGPWAYLEEDCDLPRLLKALEARGITFLIKEKIGKSPSKIRSYESYTFPGRGYF